MSRIDSFTINLKLNSVNLIRNYTVSDFLEIPFCSIQPEVSMVSDSSTQEKYFI